MKIIAGEVQPDHGIVRFEPKLRIARLTQEVPTDLDHSILEIVESGLRETTTEPWKREAAVHQTLSRMELDGSQPFIGLSAGMKRRVMLAKAIVDKPDLLLLDEPTNHLDIESILWLEGFLKTFSGSLLFVTHDRFFLQALATRILEIDRGRLFDWECDYETFLKRKEEALAAQEKQQASFRQTIGRRRSLDSSRSESS